MRLSRQNNINPLNIHFMKRTNITFTFCCLIGMLFLAACSEDELTPSGANDNPFAIQEGSNDPVSVLRRQFFDDHKIHLLFNDTLRKEYGGKDAFNQDFWTVETLAPGYNLTAYRDNLHYELLSTTDINMMKNGIELVERHILSHISGKMLPYSILLVQTLEQDENGHGNYKPIDAFTNMRTVIIPVGEWIEMNEEEQKEHSSVILSALIASKYNNRSEEAKPFFAYCEDYYYETIMDVIPDWNRNIEDIYRLGMLSYYEDYWGDLEYDEFRSSSGDFNDFFDAVMNRSEEDFAEEFGDYPIIMQKYHLMKETITNLGYIF